MENLHLNGRIKIKLTGSTRVYSSGHVLDREVTGPSNGYILWHIFDVKNTQFRAQLLKVTIKICKTVLLVHIEIMLLLTALRIGLTQ